MSNVVCGDVWSRSEPRKPFLSALLSMFYAARLHRGRRGCAGVVRVRRHVEPAIRAQALGVSALGKLAGRLELGTAATATPWSCHSSCPETLQQGHPLLPYALSAFRTSGLRGGFRDAGDVSARPVIDSRHLQCRLQRGPTAVDFYKL
jgi:hypothetical protein